MLHHVRLSWCKSDGHGDGKQACTNKKITFNMTLKNLKIFIVKDIHH